MKARVVLLKSDVQNAGGLEKYAARIARGFHEKGADVTLLTTGDLPKNSDFAVHSISTKRWPAFSRIEQFDRFVKQWVDENKPDLIFGMDRNRLQTHIRAGNGVHSAYLESRIRSEGYFKWVKCHLNPLHRTILSIEKTAFEHSSLRKLFTNSYMIRSQILDRYRVAPEKIEVIHNGVEWREMDADFSNWRTKKLQALEELALPSSAFHLLFIGNGYLRKGLVQLLHALPRLPEIFLSVIGKDNRMNEYEHLAHRLGLARRIRFFGPVGKIRPFYQYADALAIPSFYDPFANVTVEALAMGLFVVSSKSNGGCEILRKEHGSIIDDLLDMESMTHSLKLALDHPKTLASALATRMSVKHLDFSHQLETLLTSCLQ